MGVKELSYWVTTPRLDPLFGRKAPLKKYKGKIHRGILVTTLRVSL